MSQLSYLSILASILIFFGQANGQQSNRIAGLIKERSTVEDKSAQNHSSYTKSAREKMVSQESAANVRELINQLQSSNYQSRADASQKLTDLGRVVIEPLFEAIGQSDYETSFRAIRIIKQVGLDGDLDTLETIILKSADLPAAFKNQFNDWSSQAIEKWKQNQSRIAVRKLKSSGVAVTEIEAFGELGLILIDELERDIKPLQEGELVTRQSVLEQIQDLKKELAGEVVKSSKKTPSQQEERNRNTVVIGRERFVVRGGAIVSPANGASVTNPQNVTFGADWKGEPKDINNLRFVSGLNRVEFVEKKITPEILQELEKVHALRSLQLTRCTFSFDDLRKFKAAKEKTSPLVLLATGAGYLGVYGPSPGEPDNGNGSYVSLVSPNSAASEAGLERGDLIIRVDGDPIQSFAELSLVISSKPVGKAVKIAVRRNNEEKTLVARLKSRDGLN